MPVASAALRRGGEHRGGKDSVETAQRQIFINFNNFFFFLCGQYKLRFGAAAVTDKGRDKQSAEARNNVPDKICKKKLPPVWSIKCNILAVLLNTWVTYGRNVAISL